MRHDAKLPIIQTVGAGFTYPVNNAWQLIKIMALPCLLIYGPLLYLLCAMMEDAIPQIMEVLSEIGEKDNQSGSAAIEGLADETAMLNGISSLLQLAGLIVGAMIAVPVTRAIALDEAPGFIRLDGKVWWYVLGQIVFPLLVFAIMLGFGLVFGGAAAFIGSSFDQTPLAIATGFAGIAGAIYCGVRLSLFLSVLAVEGGLPLKEAWRVTAGNSLRLLGLWLLSALLFLIIAGIVMGVLFGIGTLLFAEPFGALIQAGDEAAIKAALASLLDGVMSPAGGIILGLYTVFTIYLTGVSYALPAYAYRALRGN